jgi:2-succinyl-5-enolpyruvyl-6-hydroxy-3-cyclohexene-1-carboxylate synthase
LTHPNPSTAVARVVMDELVNRGVDLVIISPGSRSGALAIAASEHPDLGTRVVIDERSAAFHALGVARSSSGPVAVVSTSGSAPANYLPAVVEADMSCVPLVVVSADRPADLQGIGANQTVDQIELFGAKVRKFLSIEASDSSVDRNEDWRKTVATLMAAAGGSPPGPVHLNVRFEEPTVPVTDDGRTRGEEYPFNTPRIDLGRSRGEGESDALPELPSGRSLLVAGDGDYDRDALARRAEELGWPILATALSGMRGREVISNYHHILSDGLPSDLAPELVVAVGSIGPSQRLEALAESAETQVRIDRWGRNINPTRTATHVLHGDVLDLLDGVATAHEPTWLNGWEKAAADTGARIGTVLGATGAMSGPRIVMALNEAAWEGMVVASSLPIRDVDAHLQRGGPVFANRGASGIDGFVSTALGVASRIPRTVALAGDLSLLHDSNGFLHDGDIDLTLVVIDNNGGGLFDTLPQALHAPDYERLFVTPPERDLEDLARFHRLRYEEAGDSRALTDLVEASLGRQGVDLVRVPVDRSADLEVRAQLDRR